MQSRAESFACGVVVVCLGLMVALLFVTCGNAAEPAEAAKAILYLDPDADMIWVDTLAGEIAAEFDDPVFGVVLCWKESRFNPKAYNKSSGCKGLFQIHPVHGSDECTYDVEKNVEAGAEIWSRYLDRNDGDRYKALKRYGHSSKTARATLRLYEEVLDAIE